MNIRISLSIIRCMRFWYLLFILYFPSFVSSAEEKVISLEERYPVPKPTAEQIQWSKNKVEENLTQVFRSLPLRWEDSQLKEYLENYVNPLTGCEYLSAYASDLVVAIVFKEEFEKTYPYELTWFLYPSTNVGGDVIPYVLFTHREYLYIHSRYYGDQRVMPQKVTSQNLKDIENNDLIQGLRRKMDSQRKKEVEWNAKNVGKVTKGSILTNYDEDDEGGMESYADVESMDSDSPGPTVDDYEDERMGAVRTFQPKTNYRDQNKPRHEVVTEQILRVRRHFKGLGIPVTIKRLDKDLCRFLGVDDEPYLFIEYEGKIFIWNPEFTYGRYIGKPANVKVDPALETLLVYSNTYALKLKDKLRLKTFVREGKFYVVMYSGKTYYDPLMAEYIAAPDFSDDEEYLVKIFNTFGQKTSGTWTYRCLPYIRKITAENERSLISVEALMKAVGSKVFSKFERSETDIRFRVGRISLIYTEIDGVRLDEGKSGRRRF